MVLSSSCHIQRTDDYERQRLLIEEPQVPRVKICALRRSNVLLSVYIPIYCTFLFLGAFIFQAIEGPLEETIRKTLVKDISHFKNKYPCIGGDKTNVCKGI